jgi:hypothetical protein
MFLMSNMVAEVVGESLGGGASFFFPAAAAARRHQGGEHS